jgi:hypothetical protein
MSNEANNHCTMANTTSSATGAPASPAPKALMPSAETLEHASHATIESPFNACRHKDYCGELRRKAMAQQQVSNTDGWKLVPVEPTQEMHDSWMYGKGPWSERYRAMLSAAQKAKP